MLEVRQGVVIGETRENDTRKRAEAREESFTVVARCYGWDFRGVFGKMRQRSETGWIVFMNCASVGKSRAPCDTVRKFGPGGRFVIPEPIL